MFFSSTAFQIYNKIDTLREKMKKIVVGGWRLAISGESRKVGKSGKSEKLN
jgi:hypothetical protein